MADIVDLEEVDKDTVDADSLEQQFSQKYDLIAETTVSLKKSYINKLHGTKSLKLAVSQSDNSIEVYQLNNTSLSRVCRLSGHSKGLTEVVFSPKEDYLLYSAGQDGLVKLWDIRDKGSCVQEYKNKDDSEDLIKPYECMDVSCNGKVLCAGSQLVQDDAYLVFWDQRMPEPLGGYWNSHTDNVTQVKFHPTKPELLASGALDGLLNIFNILESNEDDALQYSLNVENSVEKISWLDGSRVACITGADDLQLWDAGSGDLVNSYMRDQIARSIKRSKADDCYLVDVFGAGVGAGGEGGQPVLVAGSHARNGEVLRSVSVREKKLVPRSVFAHNRQVVRCLWYHAQRDLLVTGGEGGVLAVWAGAEAGWAGSGAGAVGEEGAPPARLATKLNKLHVNRHKPY